MARTFHLAEAEQLISDLKDTLQAIRTKLGEYSECNDYGKVNRVKQADQLASDAVRKIELWGEGE